MDGVMNERTTSVSNSRPSAMVLPTWPATLRSLTSMEAMDRAIQSLNFNTTVMRDDFSVLNRNVSRPMHFMNSFMPW